MTARECLQRAKPTLHLDGRITVAAGTSWLSFTTARWRARTTDLSPFARYLAARKGVETVATETLQMGSAILTITETGAEIAHPDGDYPLSRRQLDLLGEWCTLMSGDIPAHELLADEGIKCHCSRGRVEIALIRKQAVITDIEPLAAALLACAGRRRAPYRAATADILILAIEPTEGCNSHLVLLNRGKEEVRLSLSPVATTALAAELLRQAALLGP